jgi:hypothetical protein
MLANRIRKEPRNITMDGLFFLKRDPMAIPVRPVISVIGRETIVLNRADNIEATNKKPSDQDNSYLTDIKIKGNGKQKNINIPRNGT